MNTRTSERINGLQVVLGGYLHMTGALAGDQWFEGDVSCSVVRRVALPDAFFAFDGLVEAALHVLDEMGVFEAVIAAELARYLPFLATTTLLMEAVRAGAGRETAHEAIREHAVAVALEMREQVAAHNDLARRLGDDPRLPLDRAQIEALLARGQDFIGLALAQTEAFVGQVAEVGRRLPEAGQVQKARLL